MKTKKIEKVLIVRLPIDLHAQVKINAAKKNMTISHYVRHELLAALKRDAELGY